MKRTLLIAFVAVLAASQAFAFGGSVGLFASSAGASCAILAGAVTQPTILHTNSDGTTGSQFAAPVPGCSGLLYLTDILIPQVKVGATSTGLSVGYGACVTSFNIGTIFTQQLVPPTGCCAWSVIAHPGFPDPTPISTNCATPVTEEPAGGGTAIVSANTGLCPCNVSTQESTWGGVKELFRSDI